MIIALLAISHTDFITPESLRQAMDPHAPLPVTLLTPTGDLVHVFIIDIHMPYMRACARMGVECTQIAYVEIVDRTYDSSLVLDLGRFKWVHIFMHMWRQERLLYNRHSL